MSDIVDRLQELESEEAMDRCAFVQEGGGSLPEPGGLEALARDARMEIQRLAAELAEAKDAIEGERAETTHWARKCAAVNAELAQARADAERVEYCARNALALDFAYGEDGRCAVVIEIPKDARYSVGFRDIIDAARATDSAGGNRAD